MKKLRKKPAEKIRADQKGNAALRVRSGVNAGAPAPNSPLPPGYPPP